MDLVPGGPNIQVPTKFWGDSVDCSSYLWGSNMESTRKEHKPCWIVWIA